ncbi:MAG: hypothetical protein BWX71_00790 [Deltaproteobacteria bacterium ADurb.Bin072]|nr:MAG: hypothetical protein BWX71_00790 [Deltaproteobacteria bacterium ADurb.Bin072]
MWGSDPPRDDIARMRLCRSATLGADMIRMRMVSRVIRGRLENFRSSSERTSTLRHRCISSRDTSAMSSLRKAMSSSGRVRLAYPALMTIMFLNCSSRER